MSRTKVLIIAPHIDDEAIGCWSVLTRPDIELTVAYMFELTAERVAEAAKVRVHETSSKSTMFLTDQHPGLIEGLKKTAKGQDEVYIPHYSDGHADHKWVSATFNSVATHYYSIDMHQRQPLPADQAAAKRKALNTWYPSQVPLWERDHKYWLFEDLVLSNFDEYRTFTLGNDIEIVMLASEWPKMKKATEKAFGWSTPQNLMNQLIELHIKGNITVTAKKSIDAGRPCDIVLVRQA